MKRLISIAAALAAPFLFARDTNVYDRVETRKGVTYSQRGGLATSNEVVTTVDMTGMFNSIADNPVNTNYDFVAFKRAVQATEDGPTGAVMSVNGRTGHVVLDAGDVGALSNSWPQLPSVGIGLDHDVAASDGVAIGNYAIATGTVSVAIGKSSVAPAMYSTAIGPNAQSKAVYSTAIGEGATVAPVAGRSVAIGYGAQSKKYQGLAIGYDSVADGQSSFAIGIGAETHGLSAGAYGNEAKAYGMYDIAMGLYATASNGSTVAIGPNAKATYSGAVAVGSGSQATSGTGVAIGSGAKATANGAVAIGYGDNYDPLQATAQGAVAIGMGTQATHVDSVAVGYHAQSVEPNSMRLQYSGRQIYIGEFTPQSLYDYVRENAPGVDETTIRNIVNGMLATAKFLPSQFDYVSGSTTTQVAKVDTKVLNMYGTYMVTQELKPATGMSTDDLVYTFKTPDWAVFNTDPFYANWSVFRINADHSLLVATNDMANSAYSGYESLDQRISRKAPAPENYATVKSKALSAVQPTDSTYQSTVSAASTAVQPATLDTTVSAKVNQYKDLHYDPVLNVTWTNIVSNGHIYYVTVTNTNISVAP